MVAVLLDWISVQESWRNLERCRLFCSGKRKKNVPVLSVLIDFHIILDFFPSWMVGFEKYYCTQKRKRKCQK